MLYDEVCSMMKKGATKGKLVLVAVLKNKHDLDILLNKNWYRIPVKSSPKTQPDYIAFYQPVIFDAQGKCIQYYARVLRYQTSKRSDLLPDEANHLKANDPYFRIRLSKVKRLAKPIRNIVPRRISFGFTTLNRLLKAKDILQLYNVAPTEQIIENGLSEAGIKAIAQHHFSNGKKRFCLDFAIFCQQGKIALECDNKKAHSGRQQQEKDKIKNAFLRHYDWTVIRFSEQDIIFNLPTCITRVKKTIHKLGGTFKTTFS